MFAFFICLTDPRRRRQFEHEQRQERLYRLTPSGQDEFNRALAPIRHSIVKQARHVRQLKADSALKSVLEPEVAALKKLRRELGKVEDELMPNEIAFNASKFAALIKNRFFFTQSAELYGGSGGLVDFGPYGTRLKQNIIDEWRKHFLSGENAIELETAMITNEKILRASGHVEMFADRVVKDTENGECFRADKLIKAAVEKELSKDNGSSWKKILPRLDSMSNGEIDDTVAKLNIKSPISGNELSPSIDFNLMFPVKIGPEGKMSAFLRPETAQGIFANYKLLRNRQLPLTVGQVGHSFRNEISTGNGLVRTREFQMAEIEHFFDPEEKNGDISEEVKRKVIPVWSQEAQLSGHILSALSINDIMSLSSAHDNPHLAFYLSKMYDFCAKIGIDTSRVRFRQQLNEELAHYSSICFDLECQLHTLDSAWLECAGLAVRNDYDLIKHQNASGQTLTTTRPLDQPRVEYIRKVTIKPKQLKKKLGKQLSKRFNEIKNGIERELHSIDENELATLKSFHFEGIDLTLGEDVIVTVEKQTIQTEQFLPHIIEPSFGISRLVQTTLEHCYRTRQADGRSFFTFPVSIAPVKCSILTIRKCDLMAAQVTQLGQQLEVMNVAHETDVSGSIIGRKYLKSDELGVPFVIVVDDDTLRHSSVTLRDRDTLCQVRIPLDRIPGTFLIFFTSINELECVELLTREKWTFKNLRERFISQEEFLVNKTGPVAKQVKNIAVEDLTEYEAKLYVQQLLQCK